MVPSVYICLLSWVNPRTRSSCLFTYWHGHLMSYLIWCISLHSKCCTEFVIYRLYMAFSPHPIPAEMRSIFSMLGNFLWSYKLQTPLQESYKVLKLLGHNDFIRGLFGWKEEAVWLVCRVSPRDFVRPAGKSWYKQCTCTIWVEMGNMDKILTTTCPLSYHGNDIYHDTVHFL